VLIAPICVLVRAAISFGEIAAMSAVLMDASVVVLRVATWLVVRAAMACVLSASTCELLRAANAAVLISTTSAAEIEGICPVVSACA